MSMMAGYWSEFIHESAFEELQKKCPSPARVLDIGAGQGSFSQRLIDNGYEVEAIEAFSEFQVASAKNHRINLNRLKLLLSVALSIE